MAGSNNGAQQITFKYQQEGTAEGFNKLIHGVIPTGVINGGNLSKVSDTQVEISPLDMVIADGDNPTNVTVHVRTTETANVVVSINEPFILATYNWVNLADNYVTFESCSYGDLASKKNSIILGKCEFVGNTLSTIFDESYKRWSSIYYNNEFFTTNSKYPDFHVTPFESGNAIGFYVGLGNGVVEGKEIQIAGSSEQVILTTSDDSSNLYFNSSLQYYRCDIAVLRYDNNSPSKHRIDYIMGEDKETLNGVPVPPIFPSNGITLAKFIYTTDSDGANLLKIKGSNIKNIYNNNYYSPSSTVGQVVGKNTVGAHTLYL